ncbi:MAG TPA: Uma2 family endonuclease [Gemmataceae bacterium]|jgi:Uma2 family endonuclease|nr:Uma2 family endonuclease [Gemmataceae bacterium]
MNATITKSTPAPASDLGEPTWQIAYLFPNQGAWSEEEYLALKTNNLVEFSDGYIEVLAMPTTSHQLILIFIFEALKAFVVRRKLGTALLAAVRIRLWPGKFREPDIFFMLRQNAGRIGDKFWDRADLVMEVVSDSPDDRERDLVTKRAEYARARIPEYWIVDPQEGRITVLRLEGDRYVVLGEFLKGSKASSVLLPGFVVDVTEAFAAGAEIE